MLKMISYAEYVCSTEEAFVITRNVQFQFLFTNHITFYSNQWISKWL